MRGEPARKAQKAMLFFEMVRDLVTYNVWTMVIAIAITYVGVLFATYGVAIWIGGHTWGEVVGNTLGIPFILVAAGIGAVHRAITWPWRHRTHRLFLETFDVSWNTNNHLAQEAVDDKLGYLWRQMERVSTFSEDYGYWQKRWYDARILATKRGLKV